MKKFFMFLAVAGALTFSATLASAQEENAAPAAAEEQVEAPNEVVDLFAGSGEDIPLVARIICVADSYDAMATDRAYRAHLPDEVIISELEKNSGTQFDPKIAEIAIELIKGGAFNIS